MIRVSLFASAVETAWQLPLAFACVAIGILSYRNHPPERVTTLDRA